MMKVIIPMVCSAGSNTDPLYFQEVNGTLVLDLLMAQYRSCAVVEEIVFVVDERSIQAHNLDKVLSLSETSNCKVSLVRAPSVTKGALCSSLLPIDHFDGGPIIIGGSDHIFFKDLNLIIDSLKTFDCAFPTFESIHPHFSYVKRNHVGTVVEIDEKSPVSREAICGIYYFSSSDLFIKAAASTLIKEKHLHQQYFIAPCINELILDGISVGTLNLEKKDFLALYNDDAVSLLRTAIQNREKNELEKKIS